MEVPTHVPKRGFTIAGLLLAVLTTACGSSAAVPGQRGNGGAAVSGNATATTSRKPCSLLSDAQAATALGQAVDPGKPSDVSIINGCIWGAHATNSYDLVTVNINDVVSFDEAKSQAAQGSYSLEPVSGLGDDAFYQTTGFLTLLEVKKGSTVFSTDVEKTQANGSGSSDKAAERQVAEIVLSNLK